MCLIYPFLLKMVSHVVQADIKIHMEPRVTSASTTLVLPLQACATAVGVSGTGIEAKASGILEQ